MHDFFTSKPNRLWMILSGFFLTNAIVAEMMGVKLFSLEKTLGFDAANLTIFGQTGLSFNLTAGVLLWPFVFVMTDVINEYFGGRGVRRLSWLTAGLIGYTFLMLLMAIHLVPADFWVKSHVTPGMSPDEQAATLAKVSDYNEAFRLIFGQSLLIIIGSLTAFLASQLVDVFVFHKIKKVTGEGKIWLRSTGSTLISQFFDSFVVVFIAFYLPGKWTLVQTLSLAILSYLYKFGMAILMTPIIYGVHFLIERWLGKDLATEMKAEAQRN
jgi:queuosine precursor transporter